ncbi:hypothetical protein G7Z17_g111 [Cylindrodendrum hubeiense]|uniref:NmrA-like domain-containing protein n=1 Tax=Cylindrodendrum hubeiense TaxID=595255 RepID=A0A9P5LNK7_9HYPO|nr:hypothetical protein G7Z17_g111 [Cylindrodendrum hubeiense]
MPSSTDDLILVFAAAGKQSNSLIPPLSKAFTNLRLVVQSESSKVKLQAQYPSAEVVRADQGDPKAVRELFRGVVAAYYVGPSMHHQETQNGYYAVDAAVAEQKEGNFKHFIPSYAGLLIMTASAWLQKDHPILSLPYNHNIPNSHIFLDDLAEATIKIIKEREQHFHSEYPLSSTFPIAYKDLVPAAEKALQKKIEIRKAPFEETVKKLVQGQFKDNYNAGNLDVAERLVLWYERYGLNGSPNILEWLLNRKATTFEEWVEQRVKIARETQQS